MRIPNLASLMSRPGGWRVYVAVLLACMVIGVLLVWPNVRARRAAAIAEAAAWTIEGPLCPRIPWGRAGAWPYQPDSRKSFGYAGANFGFAYGHVACAQIHDDGGRALFRGHSVCQFTSPGVVAVQIGDRNAFFTPPLGRRATVSVEGGVPQCVLGGRFYGQNNF